MKKTLLILTLCAMGAASQAYAAELVDDAQIGLLVDKRLKAIDTDTDGKVSQKEFIAASEKKFTDGDTSHDGFLSKDELLAMKMKEARDLSVPEKK